jgi:predicted RNA methylase
MIELNELKSKIHKFHNKIRELNLSDVQKLMVISAIFLTIKNNGNELKKIQNDNIKKYIIECIRDELLMFGLTEEEVNTNLHEYNFIKEILNEDLLLELINDVYKVLSKDILSYEIDIINLYYEELLKYGNNDSKSLGIVLTPDDIVELMIKIANLNKDDIFLDLCCGTGSFICESLKYPIKKVIGCELQNRLYVLSVTNMIIRKMTKKKSEIIKGDCFKNTFKATKSVINPPFSMKNKELKELEFVKKQISSIKTGGRIVAIFPVSCLNANEKELKSEILKTCVLKYIINLNSKVFYPSAGVKCCIIVLDKIREHDLNNDLVRFINFENDGYIIEKQKGRVRGKEHSILLEELMTIISNKENKDCKIPYFDKKIKLEEDWNYSYYTPKEEKKIDILELKMKQLNFEYISRKTEMINESKNLKLEYDSSKLFYINDLFNVYKGKNSIKNSEKGQYPLITSCSTNNGIGKYISKYVYDGEFLTLTKNGNVGDCFYQNGKFDATSDVYILEAKDKKYKSREIYIFLATIIENTIKGRYDWGYKLNDMRLSKEVIRLPVTKDDKIDHKYILKMMKFKD